MGSSFSQITQVRSLMLLNLFKKFDLNRTIYRTHTVYLTQAIFTKCLFIKNQKKLTSFIFFSFYFKSDVKMWKSDIDLI